MGELTGSGPRTERRRRSPRSWRSGRSPATFRGRLRRQRKFGSTHPKIGQQSAHL